MPSLYDIVETMKPLFTAEGYTVYDIESFDHQKITRLDGEYPVILIGEETEETDNDGSPIDFLEQTATINIDCIIESETDGFRQATATELRKIKDIIYTNRNKQNYWCDFVVNDNFRAQLQSSNSMSKVFGGININCSVKYRENEIEGVL